MRYERTAVLHGELWRLVTGHLIHLGWAHWALNAFALTLVSLLARAPLSLRALSRSIPALAAAISLMLLVFDPEVADYVGLSGVLYGLVLLVLWPQAREGRWLAWAALLYLAVRVGWQLLSGVPAMEAALIGGPVIEQVHGYGLLVAAVWLLAGARRG
ncbi:rhombosortase [Hydrogenophaga crocea]|uniref:Rhombosortase n=1 Tax=Hydrogenophaga crocea TaxID=2716225 RepID=A0A6G8IFJ6_9BURK|nr:rhombosortase [Hydrogenophaga crocea]QIM51815.1 rhombosortase [Hydrogenophaga crocea]